MFRHRIEIEKQLLRIELLLEKLEPGAKLSAEAIQGIERQLRAALPWNQRWKILNGYRSTTAAVNRLVNMFMAVLNGKPGVGEFDTLRKAVVVAAKDERQRWDIMAETHAWLHEGRSTEDVLSQVEDRFSEIGIQIIRENDGFRDKRFTFEGEGQETKVVNPAYVIVKDEQNPIVIKRGIVSFTKNDQDLRSGLQDHSPFPEENSDFREVTPKVEIDSEQNIEQDSLTGQDILTHAKTYDQELSPIENEDGEETL